MVQRSSGGGGTSSLDTNYEPGWFVINCTPLHCGEEELRGNGQLVCRPGCSSRILRPIRPTNLGFFCRQADVFTAAEIGRNSRIAGELAQVVANIIINDKVYGLNPINVV